jgi:D-cysteine desulfhydrase
VAEHYGLESLTVKRDDLLQTFHGGTKVRKLNYLLAQPKYMNAKEWHAVGSIGSGNLVALAKFAQHLGKRLEAHCFWVPTTEGITENLAQLVTDHVNLHYYPHRAALLFRQPSLFMGGGTRVVIPPGSTNADAMMGIVRAGVELSEQIRAAHCPRPDLIYVPLGSGGTAAGLAVGLALGGTETTVCAVAVVESWFSARWRINRLVNACIEKLRAKGIETCGGQAAVPIEIKRGFLGKGYGHSTAGSLNACDVGKQHGFKFEEVYSGKTFAALLQEAANKRAEQVFRDVILWFTPHASALPKPFEDWQDRLPDKLKKRLQANSASADGFSRRRWILGSTALIAAVFVGNRCGTYPQIKGWNGKVLANWEARVLQAAIEAVAPKSLSLNALQSVIRTAPKKIDEYLAGMPKWLIREVHGLFVLVEQGTLLDFRLNRFTELSVEKRRAVLGRLHDCGWLIAQGYKGIRDLCFMAIYRHPSAWEEIQYDGPHLAVSETTKPKRVVWLKYESLKAAYGATPQ